MLVTTSPTCVIVGVPLQLSEAVTLAVLTAGTWLAHSTVTLAGHVIVGAVLSNTVIVWAHVAEFPHTSVAVYTLVIVNLLIHVIFVMTSLLTVITAIPPQLSVEVTEAILGAGT